MKSARRVIGLAIIVFVMSVVALPAMAQTNDDLRPNEQLLSELYRKTAPSVVSINIDERIGGIWETVSGGTGFVIDDNGYIVTNYHVVVGAERIIVNFFDGTIVRAEVVGIDPDSDIAVIQVDLSADRLLPITFADSSDLVVGQNAVAIGSPFGQDWTLTAGIISALNRDVVSLGSFRTGGVIQTDTPINPGNSGGPLLNLNGEVIGVNAQIISEERANSGVGFAIPSNLVQRVAEELIEFGEVSYSYLGIEGTDVTYDTMIDLQLENNVRGVRVSAVRGGQPAEMGGILMNDIIVQIDDQRITGFSSLLGYLAVNTRPGTDITVQVLREGELVELDITLDDRPNR